MGGLPRASRYPPAFTHFGMQRMRARQRSRESLVTGRWFSHSPGRALRAGDKGTGLVAIWAALRLQSNVTLTHPVHCQSTLSAPT